MSKQEDCISNTRGARTATGKDGRRCRWWTQDAHGVSWSLCSFAKDRYSECHACILTTFHIQPLYMWRSIHVAKHDCSLPGAKLPLCFGESRMPNPSVYLHLQSRQPGRLLDYLYSNLRARCCVLGQSRFTTVLWPFVASASQPAHGVPM